MVKSKLYFTKIYHSRLHPVKFTFNYDVYYYVFDLDELESGQLNSRVFGYNQWRIISIQSTDYIGRSTDSIRSKLIRQFKQQEDQETRDKAQKVDQILLITNARYFNKAFNPVNFYYCYDKSGQLLQIVEEINNTFGETHVYFQKMSNVQDRHLKYPLASKNTPYHVSSQKVFHVSPFNTLDGMYDSYFSDIQKGQFDIRINVISNLNSDSLETSDIPDEAHQEQTFDYIILTRLWSTQEPFELTTSNLVKNVLFKYPLSAFLTMPRILYRAGQLHYQKKLKVYAKPLPPPTKNTTVIIPPTPYQEKSKNFVFEFLTKFPCGHFRVFLPDSEGKHDYIEVDNTHSKFQQKNEKNLEKPINLYSNLNVHKIIEIDVKSWEFFVKLFEGQNPRIQGFNPKSLGLAYMANDFTSSDLPTLIFLLCDMTLSNQHQIISCTKSQFNSLQLHSSFGDLYHFISDPVNLFSIFFQSPNDSSAESYAYCINSVAHYNGIITDLKLKENMNILEIEPNWTQSIQGLLLHYVNSKLTNYSYTIIISDTKKYNFIQTLITESNIQTDKISILNLNFKQFCNNNINSNNTSKKFDRIISLESLECSLQDIHRNDRIPYFLERSNQLLKPKVTSLLSPKQPCIYIQSITGPYQQYQELFNKKPISSHENIGILQRISNKLSSRLWTTFSAFQLNPFQLEERYDHLMKTLSKGYINGHFESSHHQSISGDHDSPLLLEQCQNSPYFKFSEIVNMDDYSLQLEQWLQKSLDPDNLSAYSKAIQSLVKSNGCTLKMNQQEINEIFLAVQYHLSYLISSFRSVWSTSKIILEFK
ncbi:hypothetical protein DLAC_11156 [Tieghemostelium lacteum]|uniref:Uncharacterized protein n=1 Tax=Tieghemostelium lacteum TaxID=361077 RepID=A0A151Z3D3_TIELA|nr:hypothetical protein DLAC_11156 [Tieghemostelium lacteum]|eukprot:KYQ88449.1 hypothetical protein DLAC_11156 [Tieghemostelium lacteum]